MYKGFIFDFDGLIIDTEMPGCNAWVELFAQYGFTFSKQDYGKIIGSDNSVYNPAKHLSELTNRLIDPEIIREQTILRTRELINLQPLLPGVLFFLQKAKELGIPMAMASSSNRSWVVGYLSSLKIKQYFPVVCTSDDVTNVKPDPELFLLAAKKIGLTPSEIIVFEDSPNGIKAAKAASMACIAVPNEFTINMDLSLADKIVNSFQDLDPKSLLNSNNSIRK